MSSLPLEQVVRDLADALLAVDATRPLDQTARRSYRPGVGPLTERTAMNMAAFRMTRENPAYAGMGPRRYPGSRMECDLVIPDHWAIEVKLARPFGDNDKEAENWSGNLLHPYPGSASAIGDALKLASFEAAASKAVVVYGFEHAEPRISLEPAVLAFELIARAICGIALGSRVHETRRDLIHPSHQVLHVYGWTVS